MYGNNKNDLFGVYIGIWAIVGVFALTMLIAGIVCSQELYCTKICECNSKLNNVCIAVEDLDRCNKCHNLEKSLNWDETYFEMNNFKTENYTCFDNYECVDITMIYNYQINNKIGQLKKYDKCSEINNTFCVSTIKDKNNITKILYNPRNPTDIVEGDQINSFWNNITIQFLVTMSIILCIAGLIYIAFGIWFCIKCTKDTKINPEK